MIVNRVASYLQRNAWVLNLIFIGLGSYFVAGAANSVVARQIRVVPSADDMVQGQGKRRANNQLRRQGFSRIAERNLFGIRRENLDPVFEERTDVEESAPSGDFDPNNLQPCSIPISVRGTLVAADAPEWSVAVVYNTSKREAGAYNTRPGNNDLGGGATLVDIRSREIIVQKGEQFQRCVAEGQPGNVSSSMSSARPPKMPAKTRPNSNPSSDSSSSAGGVSKVSETEYNIEKQEIDRVLGNLSSVATKARIVPSFKNGKPNGFKLFSIKPGSIYSKIGLKNGDVIQKVNGYEMNSPDKALEIYQKLKDAQNVTVDVQRRGRAMTMNYSIGR